MRVYHSSEEGKMKACSGKKGRSLLSGWLMVVLLTGLFSPLSLRNVFAAEEIPAEVIEEAKKEGKLVWYATSSMEVARKMLDRFNEKYPFLKTEVYRTGSQGMLTKVLAEAQAKKSFSDV